MLLREVGNFWLNFANTNCISRDPTHCGDTFSTGSWATAAVGRRRHFRRFHNNFRWSKTDLSKSFRILGREVCGYHRSNLFGHQRGEKDGKIHACIGIGNSSNIMCMGQQLLSAGLFYKFFFLLTSCGFRQLLINWGVMVQNKLLESSPYALSNGWSKTMNAFCGNYNVTDGVYKDMIIGLSGDKEWKVIFFL